ncbi:hypothetical protein KS419_09040 [Bacillus tamaricis]|uniref:Uncharacterized protein n=1 Tax=Evansella tamaricis TaxID=2069301 RepID=A0ABS6JE77_9BACI|nr:hypothetical protein [Evansella tamaricis]
MKKHILKGMGEKTEFTLIHNGRQSPDTVLPKANNKSSIIRERMDNGWVEIINVQLRKVVEG